MRPLAMGKIQLLALLACFYIEATYAEGEKCRVIRGTMMSCIGAKEEDLPKTANPKLQWLTLSKSTFPTIKKSFMKNFNQITDFHAEKAEIEKIEDDAFKGMPMLSWIDVSENKITTINPDLIVDAKKVEHFNISSNSDLAIPKNKPFINSESLRWLDLSGCGIRELYIESFSNLPGLRDVSLSHNLLRSLPEGIFHKNPGVLSLDITNNQIATMSDKIFLNPRTMVLRFEENPWNCDCKLTPLVLWSRRNVLKGDVRCQKPTNKKWKDLANPQPCR